MIHPRALRTDTLKTQTFAYDFEQMVTAYRKFHFLYREGGREWTKSGSEGDFLGEADGKLQTTKNCEGTEYIPSQFLLYFAFPFLPPSISLCSIF
jgi:hypothetical protein